MDRRQQGIEMIATAAGVPDEALSIIGSFGEMRADQRVASIDFTLGDYLNPPSVRVTTRTRFSTPEAVALLEDYALPIPRNFAEARAVTDYESDFPNHFYSSYQVGKFSLYFSIKP